MNFRTTEQMLQCVGVLCLLEDIIAAEVTEVAKKLTIDELKVAYDSGATVEVLMDDGFWHDLRSRCCGGPYWNLPVECYRIVTADPIVDKYRELKEAYASGKTIEWLNPVYSWQKLTAPLWSDDPSKYRIYDPFADLKAAHKAGNEIECKMIGRGTAWMKTGSPAWRADFEYRVYDPLREFKEAYARGEKIEVNKSYAPAAPRWEILEYPVWDLESHEYRMYDPYRELKEAKAAGKQIEYQLNGGWHPIAKPSWSLLPEFYRVNDVYREFKEAHAAGEKIEVIDRATKKYNIVDHPRWNSPVELYRVYDPYRELKEAYAGGKKIELLCSGSWYPIVPDWSCKPEDYRVKPEVVITDPYKEFKDALAAGKKIEVKIGRDTWTVMNFNPSFTEPVGSYRVYDPYRELKEAKAAGKEIQLEVSGEWQRCFGDWTCEVSAYRVKPEVVEPEEVKTDLYADLKAACAAGKKIEWKNNDGKWSVVQPSWKYPLGRYRIYDCYRELKKAHAAGKIIECRDCYSRGWADLPHPMWNAPVEDYRIVEPKPIEPKKEVVDVYADLKAAYASGKKIEVCGVVSGRWFECHNPCWDAPVEFYRVLDEYRELKEAHARGEKIELLIDDNWSDLCKWPSWTSPVSNYRIKPNDPYYDLKAAHKAGKTIEVLKKYTGQWEAILYPRWTASPEDYRIVE